MQPPARAADRPSVYLILPSRCTRAQLRANISSLLIYFSGYGTITRVSFRKGVAT